MSLRAFEIFLIFACIGVAIAAGIAIFAILS